MYILYHIFILLLIFLYLFIIFNNIIFNKNKESFLNTNRQSLSRDYLPIRISNRSSIENSNEIPRLDINNINYDPSIIETREPDEIDNVINRMNNMLDNLSIDHACTKLPELPDITTNLSAETLNPDQEKRLENIARNNRSNSFDGLWSPLLKLSRGIGSIIANISRFS